MKIFSLILGILLSVPAIAQTGTVNGWCEQGNVPAKVQGLNSSNMLQGSYPKCTVSVYLTGTVTKATIYSNGNSTPLSNPFTANANGQYLFWAAQGSGYDIVLTGGVSPNVFPAPITLTNVFSSGGGGSSGGGVTQIVAGTNISISPSGGTGTVTISATGGGGGGGDFGWLNTDTFITSPPGDNGIANAIASSNCTPNGCTGIQPADSTSTEVQNTLTVPVFQGSGIAGPNWPDGTHIIDTTAGQTTSFQINPFTASYLGGVTLPPAAGAVASVIFSQCNPNQLNAQSLVFPNCSFAFNQFVAIGQGYNEFLAGLPSFKTNYEAFSRTAGMFTAGQFNADGWTLNCSGSGDCLYGGSRQVTVSGPCGENADECQHGYDEQVAEANSANTFKCVAGCGTGLSSFTFAPVPNIYSLNMGDEGYVEDVQNPVTSQSLGIHISGAREQASPLAYFTMSGNLPTDSWLAISTTPEMCGTNATGGASPGTNVSIPVTSSGACLAGGQVIIRGSTSVVGTIQSVPDATHIVIASLTTTVGDGTTIAAMPIGQAGAVTVTIQTLAAWNSGTTYFTNQVVTSGGVEYISLIDNNINLVPVSNQNQWEIVVGLQASTSSLGASGIACVADAGGGAGSDYYETVPWTKTSGTTLLMTFQKPHPSDIMIGIGGMCQTQLYPTAHLYGALASGGVGQANTVLGNSGATVYIADNSLTRAISVNSTGESEITYFNASSTSVTRASNITTIATNTIWDMQGHTLTISGCVDSTFNATVVATAVTSSSFTYSNSGSNGSTTGCTVVDDNAEFVYVPAVKIERIANPATNSIDGTITFYPNSVAFNTTDQLLAPHGAHMSIHSGAGFALLGQTIPRNDFCGLNTAGDGTLNFEGRAGPCMSGAFVDNASDPSIYSGLGGYKNAPTTALGSNGVFQWNVNVQQAGLIGFAKVGCKPDPIGCTGWNAPYTLFDLESVGADSVFIYHPDTHLLDFFNPVSPATLQVQNLTVNGVANLPNLAFTTAIVIPPSGNSFPAPFNAICCNVIFNNGAAGGNLDASSIGILTPFVNGPIGVGPCNNTDGNSINCDILPQFGFYAAYFKANYASTFNGVSVGLPLPTYEPVATPAVSGAVQYGYNLEGCNAAGQCTPLGISGNSILTAALSGTNTVSIPCPAALQNGYPSGSRYKLVRIPQSIGAIAISNLGTCTLGTTFVDDGSITTAEVVPTVNGTALIVAASILDVEMAGNAGNCAQYTTGGQLASSGSPCGSGGGGGGVTSIGGNGGAFTCAGSVTCTGTVITGAASGTGTVTSFSAGNLSPLFTTSVATSTTTPALTFTLASAAQNSVFAGPPSGGAGLPSFQTAPTISAANMNSFPTLNQNTTGTAASWTTARLLAGNSVNGTGNVPFANKFIVQGTADSGLSGAQFMGALGSGLLKNTTTTGVLSIAFSSDVIALWTGGCNSGTFLRGDGACAAGGGGTVTTSGSPTTGFIPLFSAAAVIGNSHLNDGVTTASVITSTENIAAPAFIGTGSGALIQTQTASNTDLAGALTLSGGSATYTFAGTYVSSPICVASDSTAVNAVKASASTTVLTLTGTGTDVVSYICVGRN